MDDGMSYWQRRVGRRVSRRGALRAAALGGAGLAGAALIGCGDDESDDGGDGGGGGGTGATGGGGTSTPEARRGGTLNVGLVAHDAPLDPALSLSSATETVSRLHYDNLVQRMHDFSLRPMLAESWEPNADLTEYVFKLREGVKFHHGKDFTSEDVVFTIERLKNPDTGSAAAAPLAAIESIEAEGDHAVRMKLNAPNAFLPDTLSLYQGRILPSDVDPTRFAAEEFGTGQYVMESFEPGSQGVWNRNPDWWDAARTMPDRIVAHFIPDPTQRIEALRSGQVDVLFPADPFAVSELQADSGIRVSQTASPGYHNLSMFVDQAPFDDIRVRKAIQLLQDRTLMRDAALFGLGGDANDHPITASDPHYWADQVIGGYDPAEARKLLAAAGHSDLSLTLHTSTVADGMVEHATAFKELAAEGGLSIDIKQASEDAYWSDVWLVEPFSCVQWNGRPVDAALSIVYLSDADWNESHYRSQELDDLIIGARGLELEGRKENYRRVQEILIEEAIRPIPMFRSSALAMRNNVTGVEAHPGNWLLLYDAAIDA